MRRHFFGNVSFAALISAALALPAIGCDEEGQEEKVALSEMIPDPVPVVLGLSTGRMEFDFSAHPIDLDVQEGLEMLNNSIKLQVINDETGTSCDLTQGFTVLTPPDQEGEYRVSASADGKIVTVVFFNWIQGKMISADGDYSAAVDVLENGTFVTESFTRDVTVSAF